MGRNHILFFCWWLIICSSHSYVNWYYTYLYMCKCMSECCVICVQVNVMCISVCFVCKCRGECCVIYIWVSVFDLCVRLCVVYYKCIMHLNNNLSYYFCIFIKIHSDIMKSCSIHIIRILQICWIYHWSLYQEVENLLHLKGSHVELSCTYSYLSRLYF